MEDTVNDFEYVKTKWFFVFFFPFHCGLVIRDFANETRRLFREGNTEQGS